MPKRMRNTLASRGVKPSLLIEQGLDSFLISVGIVALAEIGDKTQLLAFLLAARFQRPVPIIAGIFLATLFNHGLAGAVGAWVTQHVDADILRWVLGVGFLAMAAWTLVPDQIEDDEAHIAQRLGVFGATLVSFFLAEMGDKTQIATVALAAKFDDPGACVSCATILSPHAIMSGRPSS